MYHWTGLVTAALLATLAACDASPPEPEGARLAVNVAPLELAGITDACYRLTVTDGPGGGGAVVWTRSELCASDYGDGRGGLAFVGPCDGSGDGVSSVVLELLRLEDEGGGSPEFVNPCGAPDSTACVRELTCRPNVDVAVAFDLTVMRSAEQGFFDVAVSFDDIFCSAKVDCGHTLLHDPATLARAPTVVMAFACTGGLGAETALYLGDVALVCGAETLELAVDGPPGNVYSAQSAAPAPLVQLATYRGAEALTDASGTSWSKLYFNVALALDFDVPHGPCHLVATATAVDGGFDVPFTIGGDVVYPLIRVAVPLTTSASAPSYACGTHPLGRVPADRVWTDYSRDEPIVFDLRLRDDGAAVVLEPCSGPSCQNPVPVAIAPASATIAVGNGLTFSAHDGDAPYTFALVSGPGTLVGAEYTATAAGTAVVRVSDRFGGTRDATITVNAALAINPLTPSVAVGGTQLFSASGGVAPYVYSVVSGGGAFSGATFTAPVSEGSATVRVSDALGNQSDTIVSVVGTSGWITIQDSWAGHASAVRLDDTRMVVAYTDTTATNATIDHFYLRPLTRSGAVFSLGAPTRIDLAAVRADQDQAFQMMGALGPNHFFIMLVEPGYVPRFHLFSMASGTPQLVQSLSPLSGMDYNWMGHPVDDTRYLVHYGTSAGSPPMRYRLLVRSGDTMAFGPQLVRPDKNVFGGGTFEPTTKSPLVRIGATTFREVRTGYVNTPGTLASWTLTVNADNTLSSSNPITHTGSQTQTMSAVMSSNGTGTAVGLYQKYQDGWYQIGLSSNATSFHGPTQRVLAQGATYYGSQSRESTDGFINGKYYLRVENGQLYRYDAHTSVPVLLESGLPYSRCANAPSNLKSGSSGVFLVCQPSGALSIRYLLL